MPKTNSTNTTKVRKKEWDLTQLYSSPKDPKIEKDMQETEKVFADFAKKYDVADKQYLKDTDKLHRALRDYEKIHEYAIPRPLFYFFFVQSLDSSDDFANAQNALLGNRMAKASSLTTFFLIAVGLIDVKKQKEFLTDPKLKHFKFLLECIFNDAKHHLSVPEEKLMSLKSLPAREMWSSHNNKILNSQVIIWNKKKIEINKALEMIPDQKSSAQRKKLSGLVYQALKSVAVFSEGEINAVFTDKKINDELRKFSTPYEETVQGYRNDPKVIENLRKVVTDNFHIAHRFHRVKAKLLKQKQLNYCDRMAKIGTIKTRFTFDQSVDFLKKTFGSIDKKYSDYFDSYLQNGQIDVYSKKGKTGGAYCASCYTSPTFVLLNYVDGIKSMTTLAHEMGHAFHGELSQDQGPIYSDYSYSLAETASTLFESMALDAIYKDLSKADKIIILHDKINQAIASIPRQIACFNFELELHQSIRTKGFVPKEEIALIHNKNMHAYLGSTFKMIPDDGYMFASWDHIRRFFYVYSYAYGHIISQALLAKYYEDKSFWKKIEQFLVAGGNDSPENILKKIGIDVSKPDFFREGLRAIENDIEELEKLTGN